MQKLQAQGMMYRGIRCRFRITVRVCWLVSCQQKLDGVDETARDRARSKRLSAMNGSCQIPEAKQRSIEKASVQTVVL